MVYSVEGYCHIADPGVWRLLVEHFAAPAAAVELRMDSCKHLTLARLPVPVLLPPDAEQVAYCIVLHPDMPSVLLVEMALIHHMVALDLKMVL